VDFDLFDFAANHDGVFRLADAHRAGFSDDRISRLVQSRQLDVVHDNIYRFRAARHDWRARGRAAVWAGGDLCGLSHRSAARIYNLPLWRTEDVEILCRRWARTQHAGLRVHEFSGLVPSDLAIVDGLSVVVAELAVLQIAGYPWAKVDFVEQVIYAARRQRHITNASLEAYLWGRARKGRPGVRKTRAALELSRLHAAPTESEMETLLLHTLRRFGFPEPALQKELYDRAGRFVARVDAALDPYPIVFEYDSRQEHSDYADQTRDNRRRHWANALGLIPITVHYYDLQSGGHELAAAIRGTIRLLNAKPA
jgi:hypothetical protein